MRLAGLRPDKEQENVLGEVHRKCCTFEAELPYPGCEDALLRRQMSLQKSNLAV